MVGDRHPLVVGQQRIVGAEQPPDRGGVMDRGVEVGEIPDARGGAVFGGRLRHEQRPQPRGERRSACAAPPTAPRAARRSRPAPAPMNAFSVGCAHSGQRLRREPLEHAELVQRAEVEHLIADRHPAAEAARCCRARRKAANGRFCSGKSVRGCVGGADPALQRRVVRGVERAHRRAAPRGGRSAPAPARPGAAPAGAAAAAKCWRSSRHTCA